MGDTDLSEAHGSSGGITSAILEQLADSQRRVVLLEGATPGAEVREAPASSPSFAPVVQGLAHPGGYLGRNRPPDFNSKRDTWPLWEEKLTSFTSIKGRRDGYRETPNPVRVADDSLTNEDLLLRHPASTIVHGRMAWEFLLEALDSDLPCLIRMLETKSPSGAWKVMTDFYAPKTIMEKRWVAQEFDSISMVEGEDPVEYLSRIDKTVQKLAMLGGTKDDDDVNVHIVQNMSASYEVVKKILMSSPGLTRSNIEEVVENAYMSQKQNVGRVKSPSKRDDPHALYAGGAQPTGAGGNGMGRDSKGKPKNRKIQQKQQQSQQQQQQQRQQQQQQSQPPHQQQQQRQH